MDIIGVIRTTVQDYGDIFSDAWWHLLNMEFRTVVSSRVIWEDWCCCCRSLAFSMCWVCRGVYLVVYWNSLLFLFFILNWHISYHHTILFVIYFLCFFLNFYFDYFSFFSIYTLLSVWRVLKVVYIPSTCKTKTAVHLLVTPKWIRVRRTVYSTDRMPVCLFMFVRVLLLFMFDSYWFKYRLHIQSNIDKKISEGQKQTFST